MVSPLLDGGRAHKLIHFKSHHEMIVMLKIQPCNETITDADGRVMEIVCTVLATDTDWPRG